MRLKEHYSAREVAGLTGLTARQLQWWDAHGLARASIPARPTEAGGFTERRYTPIDLYELLLLAELRRRGFTVARLRRLVEALRARFGIRLFDTIDEGPVTLLTHGDAIYARTAAGHFYDLLRAPDQPLLAVDETRMRQLRTRVRRRRSAARRKRAAHTGP
jgi:DNA-binding transcriptional MerR regulator